MQDIEKRVIARKGQVPGDLTIGKMEVVVKTMLNYLNDDEMKDFVVVLPLIINQMARAKAAVK